MSNPIEIYSETVGDESSKDIDKQKKMELEYKNKEAWGLWGTLPQTQMFRAVLQDIRNKLSVGCAQNVCNVPQVTDTWIRARQVEIAMLDELLMRTMLTGELKTELFNAPTGQPAN